MSLCSGHSWLGTEEATWKRFWACSGMLAMLLFLAISSRQRSTPRREHCLLGLLVTYQDSSLCTPEEGAKLLGEASKPHP